MVFDVLLRDGSTGNVRTGHALTGSDAPDRSTAAIMDDHGCVAPNNGLVVCIRKGTHVLDFQDLLDAGFAVQVRTLV